MGLRWPILSVVVIDRLASTILECCRTCFPSSGSGRLGFSPFRPTVPWKQSGDHVQSSHCDSLEGTFSKSG